MKVPEEWRRDTLEDAAKLRKLSTAEMAKIAQKLIERASEVAITSTLGDQAVLVARSRELLRTLAVILEKQGVQLDQVFDEHHSLKA